MGGRGHGQTENQAELPSPSASAAGSGSLQIDSAQQPRSRQSPLQYQKGRDSRESRHRCRPRGPTLCVVSWYQPCLTYIPASRCLFPHACFRTLLVVIHVRSEEHTSEL